MTTILFLILPFVHPLNSWQAFRHDTVYTVSAFDLKKNCAATRNNGDEAFLAACERDRRSIYVGDLPASTTQWDLENLFSEAGEILKINLIQRPFNINNTSHSVSQSSTIRTMAFVEFAQPDMPEVAIANFHGHVLNGATIRVERKSVKDRGPTPRHSRSQLLRQKPSEESVGRGVAPVVASTPNRGQHHPFGGYGPNAPGSATAHHHHRHNFSGEMTSPLGPGGGMAPPLYSQWGYGSATPYGPAQQHQHQPQASTHPVYTAYSGPYGSMPATPQATPHMHSPWTYYNNYWPNNMMTPYDPSGFYMTPYAFQSPTPMLGGGGEGMGQFTPTRAGGAAGQAEQDVVGDEEEEAQDSEHAT